MDFMGVETLFATLILYFYVVAAHFIEIYRIKWIHESSIAIIFGIIAGCIAYYGFGRNIRFDNHSFFYFMLPPIILSAGYTLKRRRFMRNLNYILLLGVFGTVISMIVLSGLLYVAASYLSGDFEFGVGDCLLLAATLCATDQVACVAIVREEEFPTLNSVMFGESVLNDAVSILIVQIILPIAEGGSFTAVGLLKAFGSFCYMSIASVAMGIAFGLLQSFIVKRFRSLRENPLAQVSTLFLIGYLSYVTAEVATISGIITLFCAAFTMSHYAYYSLTPKVQHSSTILFKTIGYIAEAFVFTYLGLVTLYLGRNHVSPLFAMWTMIMSIPARIITVAIPLSLIYACKRTLPGLNFKEVIMLCYAGLIRGAVAFALALTLPQDNDASYTKSTTLIIVLFTTVIIGSLVPAFAKLIGLKQRQRDRDESLPLPEEEMHKTLLRKSKSGRRKRGKIHMWWRRIDDKYIKKWFGGRDVLRKEKAQELSMMKQADGEDIEMEEDDNAEAFDQLKDRGASETIEGALGEGEPEGEEHHGINQLCLGSVDVQVFR